MILVAGESLIDMLPAGDGCFRAAPGGSPYNVALALGRLGVPAAFLCPLSSDAFGSRLAAPLLEAGVDLAACPRTTALTTLGFVVMDQGADAPRYAFYTAGTAGTALTREILPDPLPSGVACVHVGSFALAVEPCGAALEAWVSSLPEGCLVSLDPNIRPFLVADPDAYRARLQRIRARADLVKVSEEDLEWLEPGRPPVACAREWVRGRTRMVVVTRGASGSLAVGPGWELPSPGQPVRVADTVGAGDTFQAALLEALWRGGRLDRAGLESIPAEAVAALLERAGRAAAITCTRPGCDPPWARELPALSPDP